MAKVTVIIVTYNSSFFVIETLNSVFSQTWRDIELVISDDCSDDNTVQLCQKWLTCNYHRFTNAQILTSNVNTGVSANANRALKASNGDWIKFLGGDDTLMDTCITDNMVWIESHPEIKVLFSKVRIYKNEFISENLTAITEDDSDDPKSIMAKDRSSDSQYKMLLVSDRLHYSPSLFIHRDPILRVGGFDERFRLLEDYPLWLNLTKNGYKLYFMNKETVNYRTHSNAINNTGLPSIVNPNYFRSQRFRQIYTYPFLPADVRLSQQFVWVVSQIFRFDLFNRSNEFNILLNKILTVYLNPFKYFIWIRKHIYRNFKDNEFYI